MEGAWQRFRMKWTGHIESDHNSCGPGSNGTANPLKFDRRLTTPRLYCRDKAEWNTLIWLSIGESNSNRVHDLRGINPASSTRYSPSAFDITLS
jgi:hypothetical protein